MDTAEGRAYFPCAIPIAKDNLNACFLNAILAGEALGLQASLNIDFAPLSHGETE
jgi:hypothetical protein